MLLTSLCPESLPFRQICEESQAAAPAKCRPALESQRHFGRSERVCSGWERRDGQCR